MSCGFGFVVLILQGQPKRLYFQFHTQYTLVQGPLVNFDLDPNHRVNIGLQY